MHDIKLVIENIEKLGSMIYAPPATIEQIDDFEKKHDIKLPWGYRQWLAFSDGGELFVPAGVQLYGIAHKPCIDINSSDKPSDEYMVIGALCSGDPILCKKDSEEIAIYNLESGRIEKDEIYSDFGAFLEDLDDVLGVGK